MKKIITISREFGSGGRYIGELLAKNLGIPFYDRELINLVAKETNYAEEFIDENEDVKTSSFLYSLVTEGYFINSPYGIMSPNDKVFSAQTQVIRDLSEKGPCVIVGRCADYILRNREDVLNVFVTCDMPHRVERCTKYYGIAEKDVEKTLRKKDTARAAKYNYYTGGEWGIAKNYDVTLNSGSFSVEKCAEIIANLYNAVKED